MTRSNLLLAAGAASVASLLVSAMTAWHPAPPVTPAAAAEPAETRPRNDLTAEFEFGGRWYKAGDELRSYISFLHGRFYRGDSDAGIYLAGRPTMKKLEDGRYEIHVEYTDDVSGKTEETLIIERHDEGAITVFGPDGRREGEYRPSKPRTDSVIKVHARDIGGPYQVPRWRSVLIIGRLGRPLHGMMTVRGTWMSFPYENDKGFDDQLRFRVTHVDGEALERPVTFHDALVQDVNPANDRPAKTEASEGDTWEMKAYENGRFWNHPLGWDEAVGTTPAGAPFGGFVTELHGVIVRVESAKQAGQMSRTGGDSALRTR